MKKKIFRAILLGTLLLSGCGTTTSETGMQEEPVLPVEETETIEEILETAAAEETKEELLTADDLNLKWDNEINSVSLEKFKAYLQDITEKDNTWNVYDESYWYPYHLYHQYQSATYPLYMTNEGIISLTLYDYEDEGIAKQVYTYYTKDTYKEAMQMGTDKTVTKTEEDGYILWDAEERHWKGFTYNEESPNLILEVETQMNPLINGDNSYLKELTTQLLKEISITAFK